MSGHAILLALGILALSRPQAAQGTIKGCVTDKEGGVLPGVEVVASSSEAKEKVVTDSSGCYELSSLPTGTYSLTASLAGFVSGKREGVMVVSGQTIDHVDFALCLGSLWEIDWVLPGGLNEAWKQADVVAYVRIVARGSVRSECPNNDFEHTAAVIEIFKGSANEHVGQTLAFVQEKRSTSWQAPGATISAGARWYDPPRQRHFKAIDHRRQGVEWCSPRPRVLAFERRRADQPQR